MLAVDSRSLPAADKGGGQTTGGRDDRSPGGIISSVETSASHPSSLPATDKENQCETNGVSYVTDCIAPAREEPSA